MMGCRYANEDAGLLPYRRPINVVVGRPIQVEQQAKPDDKYVDEVHQKYMVSGL
jgi:2-acylglycerol O-acyltransferase 2